MGALSFSFIVNVFFDCSLIKVKEQSNNSRNTTIEKTEGKGGGGCRDSVLIPLEVLQAESSGCLKYL